MVWNAWVDAGAYVFHIPTGTVGKAKKFWDGVTERWLSPLNNRAVEVAVLELEDGNAFMATNPDDWTALTNAEVRYFNALQQGLGGLIQVAARNASSQGIPLEAGLSITVSVLRTQLAALER
jgi:hypothetical protein